MTKTNKIILIIMFIPISLIILFIGYYSFKEMHYTKEGKLELSEYIKSTEIPDEQIIVLNEELGGKFFTLFSYNRDITTKTDYENWKKEIKKTGKYFNGDTVAKNYQPKVDDCELQYSLGYDLYSKKVDLQYVLSGNSVYDKELIKEKFAYPNIPFFIPPGS